MQPPLNGTRFLRVDPLGEGSVTEFEMGFAPFSIRLWAVHRDVTPGLGFTDVQKAGPMASWVHRHEYRAVSPEVTEVSDRIWFAHHEDVRGLISQLLFTPETLRLLFMYRAFATARTVGAWGDVRALLRLAPR